MKRRSPREKTSFDFNALLMKAWLYAVALIRIAAQLYSYVVFSLQRKRYMPCKSKEKG